MAGRKYMLKMFIAPSPFAVSHLGAALAGEIRAKGLSQKEAAEAMGVTKQALNCYTKDGKLMKLSSWLSLSEIMGWDISRLHEFNYDAYTGRITYAMLAERKERLGLTNREIADGALISLRAVNEMFGRRRCRWLQLFGRVLEFIEREEFLYMENLRKRKGTDRNMFAMHRPYFLNATLKKSGDLYV